MVFVDDLDGWCLWRFLRMGAGVGLGFVAVTVTAMADVSHDKAGLAAGITTTAHELGAALGALFWLPLPYLTATR